MEHHGGTVSNLEKLIEILTHDQNSRAAAGEIDQGLANGRRRAGIDAPRRLAHHQDAGLAQDFAANDEFLQIAARQAYRFRIALGLAHVEVGGRAVDCGKRRRTCRRSRA